MQQWLSKYLPVSVANTLAGLWYALLMILILILHTSEGDGTRYWGL